jgi:PAS domain S-box-containing protein
MNDAFALDIRALENFELAVLRFSPRGVCTFANAAALRLLGTSPAVGLTLEQLYADGPERKRVLGELARRLAGQASTYRTVFTQPHSGEKIPVSIFAFPETDASGEVIGSIGIVHDLREEHAAAAIHRAVEALGTVDTILGEVARQLRPLLRFDEFRVVAMSRGRRHLRTIYSTDASTQRRYPFKWWPIPNFIQKTLSSEVPRVIDIEAMFREPDYEKMAREDSAADDYRKSGVRYSLSIPIFQGKRVAAFIGIDTKEARPYDERDIELCRRLPLSQAVLVALHLEEEAKLRVCVDLVRELGANAADVHAVATSLTKTLARRFGWDHVAVFQHDEDNGSFRVLSQASGSQRKMNPKLVIPSDRGVVAQAFRTQAEINVPDIAEYLKLHADQEHPAYVVGVPGMASELAVPIPGDTPRWVLNVESRLQRAFASEEVETLRLLAVEAGHILERAALLEMRDAILRSINDAVIETDRRGFIRRANPAAERLLGLGENELIGKPIAKFLADRELAAAIADIERFSRRETDLTPHEGQPVSVLLSGSPLPKDLGGRVFVASDMTYEREVQRISALKDVFRNASLECRVPLALAANWLGQLPVPEGSEPAVERALKQIRKADLPLERLLRLATPDSTASDRHDLVDLNLLVDEVVRELPDSDQVTIELHPTKGRALVDASREGLRFCLESTLSFALRTKPQDKPVMVSVTVSRHKASIFLQGEWVPDMGTDDSAGIRHRWRRQTLTDLALATSEIESILGQAHGHFRSELDHCVRFEMEMPRVAQES